MSTVKQLHFAEGFGSGDIPAHKFNAGTNLYEPTAVEVDYTVSGGSWEIPATGQDLKYKSRFTHPSSSTNHQSNNIKTTWTQGSASGGSVPVVADYRVDHPVFNIPKEKCKITFYGVRIALGGTIFYDYSSVGGSHTIKCRINYTILNNNTFQTTGPVDIVAGYNRQSGGSFSIPSRQSTALPQSVNRVDMSNLIQQGSIVTGGARNDLDNIQYQLRLIKDSGGPLGGSPQTEISPRIQFDEYLREYECNIYIIDGLNGDIAPTIRSDFTVTAVAGIITQGSSNVSTQSILTEISQSVITGVEKTLENNFTLSAVGQVKYAVGKTLKQETELLGTTFNFRFMDPLTISADHTSTIFGNINRGLGSPLTLSTDATANFTGNMIYDNSDEYSWDDFNILDYAISGYAVAGYVTDSANYSWTELDPVTWDTWTNAVWGGQEASWETWPEDLWNSTRTLLSLFRSQQAAKLIASGVSQLLSTTALSDNSAKLKAGASTLTSDFLCDGSPAGLIGGFSTITQDAILTAFGNYIINNAQNINGAFNATLLANYIVKFLWSVSSDFSLAVTPTFKPGGITNAQCITVVNALANYKINNPQNLNSAFDPIFTARLFVGTDPYLIHKILQETRQIFVDAESRGIQIAQEIRLNSIPAEDRDYLVPQETRSMKLRIPPMTNRFTTPKVRTE
jgi:hypothetical protein